MAGTDVWVWVGHVWDERTQQALDNYGDRITDISIFGWHVDAGGHVTMTFDPTQLNYYRTKWPHIRCWLGFRNDGYASIFTGLRNSSAARSNLISGLDAVLTEYEWLYGIDIDLEQGGGSENSAGAEVVFQQVSDLAHSRGKKSSAALPPLTSTGSVGGEGWVRYKQLGKMLDHMSIMSYDFAWAGSAPGPTSPGFWMRDVYDWATSQADSKKISWGLPLYAYFWRIANPPDNPEGWRGNSGTFYAAYGFSSGHLALDGTFGNPPGSGLYDRIGWVTFRDVDSQMCWGLNECYDWLEPSRFSSQKGMVFDTYQRSRYGTRYGLPAGSPQWTVADNGPGSSKVNYSMIPREAIDIYGQKSSPKNGYNLTVELLQRFPVAATIIDDSASSSAQLRDIYNVVSGSWSFWKYGAYKQYRGSGRLDFANNFGTQALYLRARFQFANSGTFRIYCKGITAEVTSSGTVRIKKGSTVLGTAQVGSLPVGAAAGGSALAVMGLRVRENSARVYFSRTETEIPFLLKVNTTPNGGDAGIGSSDTVWVDHLYLGDGWYYQPREAVTVTLGTATKVMGRIPRTGVTWSGNKFRPNSDVDEDATREAEISLDWEFAHWIGAPVETNKKVAVKIVPTDHDTWLGRMFLFNKDGGRISYWTDGHTIAYWRAVAAFDYKMAGIALWTVGQEDMRIWDVLGDGELEKSTRIVNG